jgi:hypothetical protein
MGVILAGIAAVIVIAVGAGLVLRAEQEPAWQVYSTTSTRVGDPGSNLVGPEWTDETVDDDAEEPDQSPT